MALLDTSLADGSTRRNFRRELDADLSEFDVTDGELPPTFEFDAAVVTGSKASVYADESWIPPLLEWLSAAADRELPMLGVCFGHQALAAALGGRVEPMGAYEIGYRQVTHEGGPLFDGVPETFTVFTTHRDTVVELPPGATRTASNDYGVHGFRLGHSFGVQFHPEYDRQTARTVTRRKSLDPEREQAVLDGITPEAYDAACRAKRVFDNFEAYVRQVRAATAAD
jgi:GMP synthase (glutamine-hydrolysing)